MSFAWMTRNSQRGYWTSTPKQSEGKGGLAGLEYNKTCMLNACSAVRCSYGRSWKEICSSFRERDHWWGYLALLAWSCRYERELSVGSVDQLKLQSTTIFHNILLMYQMALTSPSRDKGVVVAVKKDTSQRSAEVLKSTWNHSADLAVDFPNVQALWITWQQSAEHLILLMQSTRGQSPYWLVVVCAVHRATPWLSADPGPIDQRHFWYWQYQIVYSAFNHVNAFFNTVKALSLSTNGYIYFTGQGGVNIWRRKFL